MPSIYTTGNIKVGIAFLVFPVSFLISQHSTKEKQGNRTVLINHNYSSAVPQNPFTRIPVLWAFYSQRKDLKVHKKWCVLTFSQTGHVNRFTFSQKCGVFFHVAKQAT